MAKGAKLTICQIRSIQQSVTKYYGNFKNCVQKFPLLPFTMLRTHNVA